MPTTLPRLALSTARKWLKGGLVAAALLGGPALVAHFMDRQTTAEPGLELWSVSTQPARNQCAEDALLFHDLRWAAACMVIAEQDEAGHAACVKDPAIRADPELGKDYCDRTFAFRDGSEDCDLPDSRAASLHALLKDAEQKCQAEARAGKMR